MPDVKEELMRYPVHAGRVILGVVLSLCCAGCGEERGSFGGDADGPPRAVAASADEAQAAKLLSLSRTPSDLGLSKYDFAVGCLVALEDFNAKASSSALVDDKTKVAIRAAIEHFRSNATALGLASGKAQSDVARDAARRRAESDDNPGAMVRTVLACANEGQR